MPILNEVMRSHPPAAETPVPVSKVAPAATTSAAPRELNADSSSIEVFAVQVLKVVAICVSCLLFIKVSINMGSGHIVRPKLCVLFNHLYNILSIAPVIKLGKPKSFLKQGQ